MENNILSEEQTEAINGGISKPAIEIAHPAVEIPPSVDFAFDAALPNGAISPDFNIELDSAGKPSAKNKNGILNWFKKLFGNF